MKSMLNEVALVKAIISIAASLEKIADELETEFERQSEERSDQ